MADDTDLTPAERELLLSVRMKAQAKARRQEEERKAAAEDRRQQVAGKTNEFLERIAAKAGVDLSTIGDAQLTGCDVCDDREPVEEFPFALVDTLCEQHAEEVTRRVAEQILRPLIPKDFHDAKPSDLRRELARWTPAVGGLYLYGETGTGKSHDAAALVKSAWPWWRKTHGRIPRMAWRGVPEMMDAIAATFKKPDSAGYDMSAVMNADVLVLDDMGIADNMPFAVRKLYVLCEHRLHAGLVTIVTSNRDLADLADHLNSPQIASRLSQMCAQVSYEGLPDRRPGNAPRLE